MFASYRSLELALLFSIYTNKQFLKGLEKFGYVQLDGFWFRCFSSSERNRWQGEKFAANKSDPGFWIIAVSVLNHPVGKYSGNC